MAKEIVVWCDPCLAEDVRTPSREVRLTIAPLGPRTLDVCDAHHDQFIKPLLALLEEFGAPADAPEPAGRALAKAASRASANGSQTALILMAEKGSRKGRVPEGARNIECLWCPLDYSAESGFVKHARENHGLADGIKTLAAFGCPVCGRDDIQLLGAHVKKSHPEFGFDNAMQALVWARENGDPHGVYQSVIGLAPMVR